MGVRDGPFLEFGMENGERAARCIADDVVFFAQKLFFAVPQYYTKEES